MSATVTVAAAASDQAELERAVRTLERIPDASTRARLAWLLEQLVDVVLASAPRSRRELQLKLIALGGRVDRGDLTLGLQKHPPE